MNDKHIGNFELVCFYLPDIWESGECGVSRNSVRVAQEYADVKNILSLQRRGVKRNL
jgi:hypothetical protein